MSHDIVIFQNAVLGNVFWDFSKYRMLKPLILLHSQILPQNKAKMGIPEMFLGNYCFKSGKSQQNTGGALMRKKGYKGLCEKKSLSKSKEVCRTYDPLQSK